MKIETGKIALLFAELYRDQVERFINKYFDMEERCIDIAKAHYKAYSTCKTLDQIEDIYNGNMRILKKLKKIATKKFIFQKGYLKLMSFFMALEKDNRDIKHRYSYIINSDSLEEERQKEIESLNKIVNEIFYNNFKGE